MYPLTEAELALFLLSSIESRFLFPDRESFLPVRVSHCSAARICGTQGFGMRTRASRATSSIISAAVIWFVVLFRQNRTYRPVESREPAPEPGDDHAALVRTGGGDKAGAPGDHLQLQRAGATRGHSGRSRAMAGTRCEFARPCPAALRRLFACPTPPAHPGARTGAEARCSHLWHAGSHTDLTEQVCLCLLWMNRKAPGPAWGGTPV